ncbi:glutamate decarboxylase [Sodiomyces alkalinus F11]|uniref:Glutamate decarboxylase n=1 Tax=Sodiomyces alkalinus (strain CBS 110278 / VKM F-3762 / F11) TaxID=1314773 RepID=A0A3N2PST7_SODAK|nr:glutamate decarboxylase [Sodiomyces alkalinus F11]ROT37575.1 glutamate decarboxylase [Sodiomyces alkalinus F11]
MVLATHVDAEDIVQRLLVSHITSPGHTNLLNAGRVSHTHYQPFDSQYSSQENFPKYKIPTDGAPADTVYQFIHDELDLDGKPNLNLASFVSTFMEENATKLLEENISKNIADADEYPALLDIHQRCISIIANLWAVQPGERAIGSATTGSSEAIHLGGLAMKRRWQERRRAEGKDALHPNIIMGANAQVALEKFARYFDVEPRILPVSAKSHYRLDPELVRQNVDENTIGVFVIMGSTYTGHYEPVEEVSKVLDEYQERTGIDIPIHVDAASGGFIAPFTDVGAGGPKWNFELPRVKSINASGHKFGLVYAGLGWIIWRDESFLPEHLIFELHYLGGTEKSFTLNFSRPGGQVIAQYFNLVHLGQQGFRNIMESSLANARLLADSLEATGWYTVVSDIHKRREKAHVGGTVESAIKKAKSAVGSQKPEPKHGAGDVAATASPSLMGGAESSADFVAGLPVVAFRLNNDFKAKYPHIEQETISLMLRAKGWIIPNYALPPNENHIEILRVVVRESMTFDLLERLVTDIASVTETLMSKDQIDLVVLQEHHACHRGPVTKREQKKKEEERAVGGAAHIEEPRRKRMANGIHRSVC